MFDINVRDFKTIDRKVRKEIQILSYSKNGNEIERTDVADRFYKVIGDDRKIFYLQINLKIFYL